MEQYEDYTAEWDTILSEVEKPTPEAGIDWLDVGLSGGLGASKFLSNWMERQQREEQFNQKMAMEQKAQDHRVAMDYEQNQRANLQTESQTRAANTETSRKNARFGQEVQTWGKRSTLTSALAKIGGGS